MTSVSAEEEWSRYKKAVMNSYNYVGRQQMSLQLVVPEKSEGQRKEQCVAGVVQEAAKENTYSSLITEMECLVALCWANKRPSASVLETFSIKANELCDLET